MNSNQEGLDLSREEEAIRRLLDRYTDAVNRRDWNTYRSLWVEAGVWELHAPIDGLYKGIEAIMKEVRRAVESQLLFVQMNHAVAVTHLEENSAQVHSTLNEIGKADPNGEGALPGVKGMNILAFYTDSLVKQNGEWKFQKRVYDVLCINLTPPGGDVYPLPKS